MQTPYGQGELVEESYSKPVPTTHPDFPDQEGYYEIVKCSVIRVQESAMVGYKQRLAQKKKKLQEGNFSVEQAAIVAEMTEEIEAVEKDIKDHVEGNKEVPDDHKGHKFGRKFCEHYFVK